ncbi:MAG TPA: cytochrome-c oxidase, cbb3-type subunit III [Pseudomonadales bacterium]
MSSFWSIWVIVITLGTIALVTWILVANRSYEQEENQKTTGHVYDGIEEYDNPLPAWWFNLFLASVIFAIGYLALYPGLGNFKGFLGWTSLGQWQTSVEQAEASFTEKAGGYLQVPAAELASQREAVKMGQRIFKTYCSTCHGVDAKGAYAFPNLTDKDWLYGGSEEMIKHSIREGRKGAMPSMGAVLGDDLDAMVDLVAQLGTDAAASHPMKGKFEMFCGACHGKDGSGGQAFGAPNLRDNIWLYGGTPGEIRLTIEKGRNGNMPAHKGILSDARIHLVAAYLFSLQEGD